MTTPNISRRSFLKLAAASVAGSLLAACAPLARNGASTAPGTQIVPQVPPPTPAATAPPAPVVMDIWNLATIEDINAEWQNDPGNVEFQKQWIFGGHLRAEYRPWLAKHPGVTLNITYRGWDWELRQNQYRALAAGIIPDTTYGEGYVSEFVSLGIYSPVSDAARALFPESTCRYAVMDGKAYGLPESTGATVLFVNLDKVEQAGLDPARLPTTWDELLAMAQAISRVNQDTKWGNNAFFTGPSSGLSYETGIFTNPWFVQNHAPLGTDLGLPSLNLPGAADAWLFLKSLLATSQDNLLASLGDTYGGTADQALVDGVVALKPGWTGEAKSVADDPKANVTAIEFPLPPGGQPASVVVGNQVNSALKNGPHPELAIDFIEGTTTDADAQAWLGMNNYSVWMPSLKSILEQYETYDKLQGYGSEQSQKIVRVTMKTVLDGGAGPLPGWPHNPDRIWTAWNELYDRIWHGHLSKVEIQKELDTLQTKVEGFVTNSD